MVLIQTEIFSAQHVAIPISKNQSLGNPVLILKMITKMILFICLQFRLGHLNYTEWSCTENGVWPVVFWGTPRPHNFLIKGFLPSLAFLPFFPYFNHLK